MVKIVALDVLTGILKQVYNKTKEYTDGKISISLDSLRSLIRTNNDNIKTEYENKFSKKGCKIYRLKAIKK